MPIEWLRSDAFDERVDGVSLTATVQMEALLALEQLAGSCPAAGHWVADPSSLARQFAG